MVCTQVHHSPKAVPFLLCPWPIEPWQRIDVDNADVKGQQFLLVVDSHSKWMEFSQMRNTTANATIEVLRALLSKYGLPLELVSDNGPQFVGGEFQTFKKWIALKCIWQIFFICSIKSPQCADKCTKKVFFHSDFPFPCFDIPKASNFTSSGVQNHNTKNWRLGTIVTSIQDSRPREKQISSTLSYFLINYHFLAKWLAHNKKKAEKSVFREAWSPELTSQSFRVSCFWCRGFVPHRKWNLTLLAHQNTGSENRYRKNFWLHLSAHWGDLIEQIKKKSVLYTLTKTCKRKNNKKRIKKERES